MLNTALAAGGSIAWSQKPHTEAPRSIRQVDLCTNSDSVRTSAPFNVLPYARLEVVGQLINGS